MRLAASPLDSTKGMGIARVSARDRARLREWRQRIANGMTREQAWLEVIIHPVYGYSDTRGAASVPETRVHTSLARFCERMLPDECEAARVEGLGMIVSAVPDAARRLTGLATGAKDIDDANAERLRFDASKIILQAVSVLPTTARGSANVAVQVNTAVNLGTDALKRMLADPQASAALAVLETAAAKPVGEEPKK